MPLELIVAVTLEVMIGGLAKASVVVLATVLAGAVSDAGDDVVRYEGVKFDAGKSAMDPPVIVLLQDLS